MLLAQTMERVEKDGGRTRVAQARVTAVWVGPDRKPMRVPDDVQAGLSGHRGS
jgi:acyl-CoA thioesterase FadM